MYYPLAVKTHKDGSYTVFFRDARGIKRNMEAPDALTEALNNASGDEVTNLFKDLNDNDAQIDFSQIFIDPVN